MQLISHLTVTTVAPFPPAWLLICHSLNCLPLYMSLSPPPSLSLHFILLSVNAVVFFPPLL